MENIKSNTIKRINPIHTFDNYVVGESNNHAFMMSEEVVQNPGKYNPLYIYGNSGLGKTHLSQAVVMAFLERKDKKNVIYINSEDFTNELISSIKDGSVKSFRTKYRTCDCLILEDIEFFRGKEATQQELYYTISNLISDNKQVVVTADKSVAELGIYDKLCAVLSGGIAVGIEPSDLALRLEILKRVYEMDIVQSEDIDAVMQYIAENITDNRNLIAAFRKVIVLSNLKAIPISLESAKLILSENIKRARSKEAMTIPEMQKEVYKNKIEKGFNVTDISREFCLLYGEVAEAFEAWRKHLHTFGEELADVAIYLMGISELEGIDLQKEIERKIQINRGRNYCIVDGVLKEIEDESEE